MNSSTDSQVCSTCKTRQVTMGVWECLVENPPECPHSLEFGYDHHICRHSEPHSFRLDKQTKLKTIEKGDF